MTADRRGDGGARSPAPASPRAALAAILLLSLSLAGCLEAPPQIVTLDPVNGSTNVAADAPVQVAFDHAVARDSVATRFHIDPGLPGCDDLVRAFGADQGAACYVRWASDSGRFTLMHPGALFQPATKYTLTLSPGISDSVGSVNSLDHKWELTSKAAPAVRATSPADGESGVPVDQPLVVDFDSAMSPGPTGGSITVDPPVPGTRVVPNARSKGRFVVLPGRLLSTGTAYTVAVGRGAVDEHGQPVAQEVRARFRTGGELRPGGHAVVLARRAGEGPSEVLISGLGPLEQGEQAPSATVLLAPRCGQPSCGAARAGQPLVEYLAGSIQPTGASLVVVELDRTLADPVPSVHRIALPGAQDTVIAPAGSLPRWSPDGRLLAYSAPDGVHVRTIDTGADQRLPPGDALTAAPAWSADGSVLALPVVDAASHHHVELASPSVGARFPVPGLSGEVTAPVLSPDASVLAVRRDGGGDDGTWLVSLGGPSAPGRLGADLTPVAFSGGAGTLIEVQRPGDGPSALTRVDTASGDRTVLGAGPDPGDLSTVDAAANGRQLAYLRPDPEAGVRQAWIENSDGSNPVPLTIFTAGDYEAYAVTL